MNLLNFVRVCAVTWCWHSVAFITTQNCSSLICVPIPCHWKFVYCWQIIVVRSSTCFRFIPYIFCLYVILTSSFLQESVCPPSNSTGGRWMKSSVKLSLHSHVWVFHSCDNFWNQPLPLPTSIFAICWMRTSRWESFSMFVLASGLVFSCQPREGRQYTSKPRLLSSA